jgi:hypothetical protein
MQTAVRSVLAIALLTSVAADARAQASHSLAIVNDSTYTVRHLYVSSSYEDQWGSDQFGSYVLRPGGSFTLTNIHAGSYDIKFVDEDQDACILRQIRITADTSWKLTSAWLLKCEGYGSNHPAYSLSIANESPYDIHQVFLSPTATGTWGADRLGDDMIGAGHRVTLSNIASGHYDVKFVDEDGDACVVNDVNITSNTSWRLTTAILLRCESFTRHR